MADNSFLDEPIFKYRAFGGEFGDDNIKRIIVDSEMLWQSPTSFNDPFDCAPFFIFGSNDVERQRYIRPLVDKYSAGKPRIERRQERKRLMAFGPPGVRETAKKVLARSAMLCFTTKNDDMLMWSHYAENHTGVCFQFSQLGPPDDFVGLPVFYSDDRPAADITKMDAPEHEFLRSSVLTKAKCWEYESERRMLASSGGPGFRKFPPKALTGIILGAKIKDDKRDLVLSLLSQSRTDIKIKRAELDDRHYRLNIRNI